MEANEYQIGGKHYQKEYQHWDFITDNNLPYLIGCATKYVCRWRDKAGIQDLRKALHYINKAEEKGIKKTKFKSQLMNRFCHQFPTVEGGIIQDIAEGEFISAVSKINKLIEDELAEPSKNYIDPDNNYFRG